MFARGNWAVLGIDTESHTEFVKNLNTPEKMLSVSQLAASAITRHLERGAVGINPYSKPRQDEEQTLGVDLGQELATYATTGEANRGTPSEELLSSIGFSYEADQFRLHGSVPLYAFWFVTNEWKDVADLNSIKEQRSYEQFERPYKFLNTQDKKALDAEVSAITAAIRKQFTVFLDFQSGFAYIESTNKNTILSVRDVLETLGVGVNSVGWSFGPDSTWLQKTFDKLYSESQYLEDFKRAADDAGRFDESEREVIDDPEKRNIVRNYFAMTELESSLWAGLSSPAQIRLHKTLAPISVQSPVSATTLLGITDDTSVAGASITLQERISSVNKKTGEERVFRKDLLSFDLTDGINQVDAGAAMLRGFDLPSFKKDIMREIKKSKQIPSIQSLWLGWLVEMGHAVRTIDTTIRELLEIKDTKTGILPMFSNGNDEVIEEGGFSNIKKMIADGDLTVSVSLAPHLGERSE